MNWKSEEFKALVFKRETGHELHECTRIMNMINNLESWEMNIGSA